MEVIANLCTLFQIISNIHYSSYFSTAIELFPNLS